MKLYPVEMAFVKSKIFKGMFWLLAGLLALLCAARARLIFQSGIAALLAAAAVMAVAFFLYRRSSMKTAEERAKLLAPLLAVACVYGLSVHMPQQEKSIVWLVICGLCAYFLRYALMKKSSLSVRRAAALLGALFALLVLLGTQLKLYGRLEFFYTRDAADAARVLFCTAGEAFLFTAALNLLFACSLERESPAAPGPMRLRLLPVYTALVFISWLPYFYAFYPGLLSPDSINEISQQLGLLPQSNNHPYLHQLSIGACLSIGGSLEAGVRLYTLLQMLLMAVSYSLCALFLESRGVGKWISRCVLAFLALFPVNAFYSMTMWKNVVHGAVCLDFMMLLIALNTEKAEHMRGGLVLSALAVLMGFFFCTFLNNAWYALLVGYPLYILCNRRNWKRLGGVFLLIVLMVSGYNRLVFNVLEVIPSSTGEILSIPLQQIARVAQQNPEELESGEFQVLEEVFYDMDTLGERYKTYISDPVKAPDSFRADVFDKDPGRYAKSWAAIGARHPLTYLEAFLHLNYGYWYPDVSYWIVHNSVDENSFGLAHRAERLGVGFELSMLTRDLSELWPLSVIFSLGLMVWLLLTAAVLLILKGQKPAASTTVIFAALWLTVLASPVYCEYRYLYSLVLSVPLYLGLALGLPKKG